MNNALAEAIRHAASVFFTEADSIEQTRLDHAAESVATEFEAGAVRLQGIPLRQDLQAYVLALLAVRALAACRSEKCPGEYRTGALHCLLAAAAELRHRPGIGA